VPGKDWLTARPIAHRGYHDAAAGRIENTLSAFRAAVERRLAIECDLQLTADGEVVVFHDDTLDRLTDAVGRVDDRTLAALRSVAIRGTSDRIPTLSELLDLTAGKVPLVIELKSRWNGDRRLENATAAILAAYSGPVAVMSFDPASAKAMGELMPHVPRGLVADRCDPKKGWGEMPPVQRFALRHLLYALKVAPQFIAYDVTALPANAPLLLRHTAGMPLLTWTVKSEADRATAARWADQMIFEGFDPEAISPRRASAGSA
jgi:glycerophosphoryl diester phosphodiesterase